MSAALAVPGSGAHQMTVRQAQAIDAELATRRPCRAPFGVDPDRVLEALRLEWGGTYDVGFADRTYWAARLDGTGDLLRGATPDELGAAIRADWGGLR